MTFDPGWLRQGPECAHHAIRSRPAAESGYPTETGTIRVGTGAGAHLGMVSPGRIRFSRNVKVCARLSPASRARKRWPSAVTAYCGRLAVGSALVRNNVAGTRATNSPPGFTPTLMRVPSGAR